MAKRKLFIEGENLYGRAYFGWQDHNTALYGLKEGYLNSANNLLETALENGCRGDIATLDTYIFPIFFLYRHSIEISIKAIYYRFYGKTIEGGHNLSKLWLKMKNEIIKTLEDPDFIEEVKKYKRKFIKYSLQDIDLDEIQDMIEEINNIDKKADAFRYLMDNKGDLYFISSKFIDYPNLKENMNYLYDVLDFINHIVDEYLSS